MKWLPTLISAGVAILGAFTPSIQGVFSAHPAVTSTILSVWAIFSHLLPSPAVDTEVKSGS